MMRAMIELGGVVTNCTIYFLTPKFASTDIGVNLDKVHELGFDCFVHVDNEKIKNNEFFINSSKTDAAEIQIISKSMSSIIRPSSNVEVKIIRDYNAFQWIGFGALSLYRMIKGKDDE